MDNEGDSDADEPCTEDEDMEAKKDIVVPDTDEIDLISSLLNLREIKKHEHAHELTALLDEMLERGSITRLEYSNLNSVIAKSELSSEEGAEEEREMASVIKDTVDHVNQYDKDELSDLIMELRDKIGEELLDALLDLELLESKFLIDEFQEGESLLPLIEEQRLKLKPSPASISKLLRVKMLLSNINNNRRRVQEIFQRIDDAEDNEEDIWKLLARHGLISDDQFQRPSRLGNADIETIASLPFLPTSLKGLRTMFGALWTEFDDELLLVLKELLRRRGITDKQYSVLIKEFDKL